MPAHHYRHLKFTSFAQSIFKEKSNGELIQVATSGERFRKFTTVAQCDILITHKSRLING